jgi:hypothetical protein
MSLSRSRTGSRRGSASALLTPRQAGRSSMDDHVDRLIGFSARSVLE